MMMQKDDIERYEVYIPDRGQDFRFRTFRQESGNSQFQVSWLTWVTLGVLLILYPAQALLTGGESMQMLKDLNEGMRLILLISTVLVLWGIYLLIVWATHEEKTDLIGIGYTKFRPIYIFWAGAFVLAANLILAGLSWGLAQIGHPMPGEIALLLPETLYGKIIWFFVSITAGFCEETAFRGYLMTRLRLLHGLNSWVVPTILSSVAFGICHSYQGVPGLIVISVYGTLFALLYIRTGSIWPCIIAHFFQDFSALFFPQ